MAKQWVLSLILLALIVMSVSGQERAPRLPRLSDYEITQALEAQEIANFPLDEAFLDKIEKIQAELVELPIEADRQSSGDDLTVSGLTHAIEAHPEILALLKRHDIGARDYVLGKLALSNALLAAIMADDQEEELFFDEPVFSSPENLEFGRQYADRIRALHGS